MKKQVLPFILCSIFSLFAQAQITITADDFPNIGGTLIIANSSNPTGISIGLAGANQTYDFSAIVAEDTSSNVFIDPANTPGNTSFPNATLAAEDDGAFIYFQETANEATLLGSYIDTSENNTGQYFAFRFNPGQKIIEFPSTFNTSYTDTWGSTLTFDGAPLSDSIRTTSSTVRDVLFDGYGTVITPDGSYDGLRERVYSTTTTTTEALALGIWTPIFTDETSDTSYNWYAKESMGPLVTVGITDGIITDVSYTIVEEVSLAPDANFSVTNQGGGVFDFLDLSANAPTSWTWDFGDTNTSTEQNPQHTFAATGTYNVCLTVSNDAGSDMTCSAVEFVLAPVAAFNFTDQGEGLVDFTDASTNNPTSWAWDFGDGTTSTDQSPQYMFAASGTYNVCLTVSNDAGSDMVCSSVEIVLAPIAAFNSNGLGDGVFDFSDASTNNPTSWLWDFGDGNTSTDQNPQHTYTTPGTYSVCLTASNDAGSDMVCVSLEIILAPVAAFNLTDQGMGIFDFTDASTNNPTSWLWDFGDGTTSTDQNPQHTFAEAGMYNVCLTSTNSAGSNTECQEVNVVITSSSNTEQFINILVAPNPVKNVLSIRLESDGVHQLNFQLVNPFGQVSMTKQVQSNQSHDFDVSRLASGVYYYVLKNNLGQVERSGSVLKVD